MYIWPNNLCIKTGRISVMYMNEASADGKYLIYHFNIII